MEYTFWLNQSIDNMGHKRCTIQTGDPDPSPQPFLRDSNVPHALKCLGNDNDPFCAQSPDFH